MSGQPGNAQLRVAPLAGGPTALVTATSVGGPGASWGTDGFIYFDSSGIGPLRRVKETGGDSEVISTLDTAGGELQHDWPDALPGGRGVLITINRGGPGVNISQSDDIGVLDLATGRHRMLVHGVLARYAASGHIVYVTAEGVLMAAPFDEGRLEVTGDSVALIEDLNFRRESGGIDVALSQSGTLWYAAGAQQGLQEVVWASPSGEVSRVDAGWTGAFRSLSLSPNGTKLALAIADATGHQIWIKDLGRPGGALVAKDFNERGGSVSPDGRWLAFWANPTGRYEVYVRPFPDTSASQVQVSSGGGARPVWSRDGREIFYANGRHELTRVALVPGRTFATGKPSTLLSLDGVQDWDVAADGRVILIRSAEAKKGGQLIVVEDFFEELRRKVPTK